MRKPCWNRLSQRAVMKICGTIQSFDSVMHRLDAFGAILNKGLALTGVDGNHNPLEGALARNVGEVIGVYGHVDVERHKLFGLIDRGYSSSVRLRALRRIEKHVVRL